MSANPYWLVGVQLLDGVGPGVFGALFPLVVQDVTHGSGRFNVSLGAVTAGAGFFLYLIAMPETAQRELSPAAQK